MQSKKTILGLLVLTLFLLTPMMVQPTAAWFPSVRVTITISPDADRLRDTGTNTVVARGGTYIELTIDYWHQGVGIWVTQAYKTAYNGRVQIDFTAYPRPYRITAFAMSGGAWDADCKYINWYPDYSLTHPSHSVVLGFADNYWDHLDPGSPSTRETQLQDLITDIQQNLDSVSGTFWEEIIDYDQIAEYYNQKKCASCEHRMVLLVGVLQALSRQGKFPIYDIRGWYYKNSTWPGFDHYFVGGTFWNGTGWAHFFADIYPGGTPQGAHAEFWYGDEYRHWDSPPSSEEGFHGFYYDEGWTPQYHYDVSQLPGMDIY
jgi:hypothetical protein